MSAPRRLLDDPSTPEALRDDLRVAIGAVPRYDAERGLAALQAAVATLGPSAPFADAVQQATSGATASGTSAQAAATSAGAAGTASSVKLAVGALVAAVGLGIAGTATWMKRAPVAPASPPASAAAPTALSVPAPAPLAPVPTPVVAPTPAPVTEPTTPEGAPAAHAGHAAPRPVVRERANTPVDADVGLRREIDHLARVKGLIEQDPNAAYALAQEGNRTLSSMLREERDGLSVLALDRAGDRERARRLAHEFVRRYPHSPLRARIEALAAPAKGGP